MASRVGIEVSGAVAHAAMAADVDVVSAYPITPQTHIVEDLSVMVANGELNAAFVPVESEHSAISAAMGSAATGVRVFTATAAQGLALMHEILFITSSMRLPMVMVVSNRALSGPISIWNDHSDIMAERDIGWIQLFAENGQEAFDLTIAAFAMSEDPEVLLPAIVNMDGFILSHVIEPVEILTKEEVSSFLERRTPPMTLDPTKPITLGAVGIPDVYMEAKKQVEQALLGSKPVVKSVLEKWADHFGRRYEILAQDYMENAETVFVTMGSLGETILSGVGELRDQGHSVGRIGIRLWRPFPGEELLEALQGVKRIIVVDRALSPGAPAGPVAMEIKTLLFDNGMHDVAVENVLLGLGGRDVTRPEIRRIYEMAGNGELDRPYHMWGVESR